MSTRAAAIAAALAPLAWVAPAIAQTIDVALSSRTVEVGEEVRLDATVLTSGPTDRSVPPKLRTPAGLTVRGPALAPRQQVTIVNGQVSRSYGLTASWFLTPTRTGTFTLGPASFTLDGRVVTSSSVRLSVVEKGHGPARSRGWPFDLIDPFAASQGIGPTEPAPVPEPPADYKVAVAPDTLAFLRVTLSPERAVVGEQITLRAIAYGARGAFRPAEVRESPRPDFLGIPLADDDGMTDVVRVPIGDATWYAVEVRETALFPLRSGRLTIGSMGVTLDGTGYLVSRGTLATRSSEPVTVIVSEPPLAGRPIGYRLGDVGNYRLTATVEPRTVHAGEAFSVVARLEGKGNLPSKLRIPQQRGLTFLEPTLSEKLDTDEGRVGGWRTFTFVVRAETAGQYDLGELTLPYWDPAARAYAVARAGLGSVTISAALASESAAPDEARLELPARAALGAFKRPTRLADRSFFWWWLFGAPTAVVVGSAGLRALSHLTTARRARAASPRRRAEGELALARRVGGSERLAAIDRAIFQAIEGATLVKARGVLRGSLAARLTEAGLSGELAAQAVALLELTESARFAGNAGEHEALERAARLVATLARVEPRDPGAASQ